jgi:hypothetical protein
MKDPGVQVRAGRCRPAITNGRMLNQSGNQKKALLGNDSGLEQGKEGLQFAGESGGLYGALSRQSDYGW